MINLPEPNSSDAQSILVTKIIRKKREDYKQCLQNNKIYILTRYYVFEKNKLELKNIGSSYISHKKVKNALHTSFNNSFIELMKDHNLYKIYRKCKGICPYCGDRKIDEIDHYVPKEKYPEFTLYPANLIPICSKCNKKKLSKFINNNKERQFINYYYDEIGNLNFLKVDMQYKTKNIENSTHVKYNLDLSGIKDTKLKKVVNNHFVNLNLLKRYEECASSEITNLVEVFSNQSCKDIIELKKICYHCMEGERNKLLKSFGVNNWKYLLYEKIMNSNFFNILIEYICS